MLASGKERYSNWVNWLKRLFGRKESKPTGGAVGTPERIAPATKPEPVVAHVPPPDAVAVAHVPDVAVLLQRAEERKAFERAFLEEGLSVEAPAAPELISVSESALPKLVVVDDRSRFDELIKKPIDVTDDAEEEGPIGDHAYIAQRPVDLSNPLGK